MLALKGRGEQGGALGAAAAATAAATSRIRWARASIHSYSHPHLTCRARGRRAALRVPYARRTPLQAARASPGYRRTRNGATRRERRHNESGGALGVQQNGRCRLAAGGGAPCAKLSVSLVREVEPAAWHCHRPAAQPAYPASHISCSSCGLWSLARRRRGDMLCTCFAHAHVTWACEDARATLRGTTCGTSLGAALAASLGAAKPATSGCTPTAAGQRCCSCCTQGWCAGRRKPRATAGRVLAVAAYWTKLPCSAASAWFHSKGGEHLTLSRCRP